ncbi:MAG: hypothetical protein V2I56_19415 [Desulfobacteraceae bacterium]|jgi:hypothetical protein|nr:hypothetical protein [Desulfobacteraceae bacterium]
MKQFKSIPTSRKETDNMRTDCAWIDEDDLPVRADLKVLQVNDPDTGLSQEDKRDRNEFVRCYLLKEFEVLLMLPKSTPRADFFIKGFEESAFNTEDYYRLYATALKRRPASRIKLVLEQVKQLALLHSCIASPEGRARTTRRYQQLINTEFRNRTLYLAEKYRHTTHPQKRSAIREKISELNQFIVRSQREWERHAPRDG